MSTTLWRSHCLVSGITFVLAIVTRSHLETSGKKPKHKNGVHESHLLYGLRCCTQRHTHTHTQRMKRLLTETQVEKRMSNLAFPSSVIRIRVCVCVCGELLLYAAPLPLLEHIFGTIPKMVPLIFFFFNIMNSTRFTTGYAKKICR